MPPASLGLRLSSGWLSKELTSTLLTHRPSHQVPDIALAAMSTTTIPRLFQPIRVGQQWLSHRVVLAPLTRYRANNAHVHGDLAVAYYDQRATIPGTLLITEATFISANAGGYDNIPGIWNDEQVAGWKRVSTLRPIPPPERMHCQAPTEHWMYARITFV